MKFSFSSFLRSVALISFFSFMSFGYDCDRLLMIVLGFPPLKYFLALKEISEHEGEWIRLPQKRIINEWRKFSLLLCRRVCDNLHQCQWSGIQCHIGTSRMEMEVVAASNTDCSSRIACWGSHPLYDSGSPDFLLVLWASQNPINKALYCLRICLKKKLFNKYEYSLLTFIKINEGLLFKVQLWKLYESISLNASPSMGGIHSASM